MTVRPGSLATSLSTHFQRVSGQTTACCTMYIRRITFESPTSRNLTLTSLPTFKASIQKMGLV